jgi:hypothetical protein
MEVSMERKNLTTMTDHWFSLVHKDQRWSFWRIRNLGGRVATHELSQKDIPKSSRMTFNSIEVSREIVPQQGDEPLGSEVIFPLIS